MNTFPFPIFVLDGMEVSLVVVTPPARANFFCSRSSICFLWNFIWNTLNSDIKQRIDKDFFFLQINVELCYLVCNGIKSIFSFYLIS